MAWEVHFSYYEKKQEGRGYETENPKTFKKQIGTKMEEVPLEKVAAEIVKQMARRDVLVEVDAVYEYTKKAISFKETKGGVVIKGQKFNLDGMAVEPEVQPEPQFNNIVSSPTEYQVYNQEPPKSLRERMGGQAETSVVEPVQNTSEAANLRILRVEEFDPDDSEVIISRLAAKGMHFTLGKRYPIFKEIPKEVMVRSEIGGAGNNVLLMYKVTDDNNKIAELPSTYFRMPSAGLTFIGKEQSRPKNKEDQPKLLYMGRGSNGGGPINVGNDTGVAMPSLRRGIG